MRVRERETESFDRRRETSTARGRGEDVRDRAERGEQSVREGERRGERLGSKRTPMEYTARRESATERQRDREREGTANRATAIGESGPSRTASCFSKVAREAWRSKDIRRRGSKSERQKSRGQERERD